MVITFPRLPLLTDSPIQSVYFTSSENKCVKQRRINTVHFILVVLAVGFVSSFLREVQSTIDRAALTHVSQFYKPVSYLCHAPGMPCRQHLKKGIFILSLNVSVNCLKGLSKWFFNCYNGNLVVVGLMMRHLSNQA